MLSKIVGYIIIAVAAIVLLIALVAFLTWILMLAWNTVMPMLFGLPKLNMLQTLCLSYVANALLKSSPTIKTEKKTLDA